MITSFKFKGFGVSLIAGTAASVLAACASTPVGPAGAVFAPAPLAQAQFELALRDPALLATPGADAAVRVAEQPGAESHQEAYRVYLADQKVDIVRAKAGIRPAEEHRPRLRTESKQARLEARARELGLAQSQAVLAELEGAEQTLATTMAGGEAAASDREAATSDQQASDARREAECAELATSISRQPTARQQPENELLQARITGYGLVVTLAGFAVFK